MAEIEKEVPIADLIVHRVYHLHHLHPLDNCGCSTTVRDALLPLAFPAHLYDGPLDNPEIDRWVDRVNAMVGKKSGKALLREEGTRSFEYSSLNRS